jgi:hypothetical protein
MGRRCAPLIQPTISHVRTPANGYISTPFAEDVELSVRIG